MTATAEARVGQEKTSADRIGRFYLQHESHLQRYPRLLIDYEAAIRAIIFDLR